MGVVLGNICESSFTRPFVLDLVATYPLLKGTILGFGDHDLGASRNKVVARFLHDYDPEDFLWFVDSDMTWNPDDLPKFFASADNETVMGGAYKRPTMNRVKGKWLNSYLEWDARAKDSGDQFSEHASGIHEAAYVGAGAMLIPYPVLASIERDWFTQRGRGIAEDLSFCLRVWDAGFKVACNFDFRLGHVKPGVLY